jgi:hypothetical protein
MLEECVADCKGFINDQHLRRGKKSQWQKRVGTYIPLELAFSGW